jgi:hypothetical protein
MPHEAPRGSLEWHWYDAAAMAQALVLNATYEPLSVVPARRAVVLVIREKAELVESDGRRWASERTSVPVPSVIRLLRYVRVPYQRRVALSRRAVFVRERTLANTAGHRPRTWTTFFRGRGAGVTPGRTWWLLAGAATHERELALRRKQG